MIQENLPWVGLGSFPTPVAPLENLSRVVGLETPLWIKRDDLSGSSYGSNKVRKLEFLVGRTLARRKRRVLVYGPLGSNYVVAALVYAKKMGLQVTTSLFPQAITPRVLGNLNAILSMSDSVTVAPSALLLPLAVEIAACRALQEDGMWPEILPMGGSSPLGTLGCLNGVFELRVQMDEGQVPEPSAIVVALGTAGTAAGLLLGVKLAKIQSRIVAVRVVDSLVARAGRVQRLARRTLGLMRRLGCPVPSCMDWDSSLTVEHGYFGKGYAYWTSEGMDAVRKMKENEGIQLEGTYTGKALACAIQEARKEKGEGPVLFWNTYSSVPAPCSGHGSLLDRNPEIQGILSRCPSGTFDEGILDEDRMS